MRSVVGTVAMLVFISSSLSIVRSTSTGPPAGASNVPAGGSFSAEITCSEAGCHDAFPLNPDNSGRVELLGVPDVYMPGQAYPLTFRISHPEAGRWGFQLTAVAVDTFRGAGDFAPDDQNTQKVGGGNSGVGGRVYIQHGATGRRATGIGEKGSYGWTFAWVAPVADVGDVAFYGAGNAANADGTTPGDKIYSPGMLARATSPRAIDVGMPMRTNKGTPFAPNSFARR